MRHSGIFFFLPKIVDLEAEEGNILVFLSLCVCLCAYFIFLALPGVVLCCCCLKMQSDVSQATDISLQLFDLIPLIAIFKSFFSLAQFSRFKMRKISISFIHQHTMSSELAGGNIITILRICLRSYDDA